MKTLSPDLGRIILSRDELVKIFRELNDTLRGEGLRAGIERFSEFSNILFLKLLSENEKESYWDFIKKLPDNRLISALNDSVIKEIEDKYGGNVFTPISIQNPRTLRKIIERLDPLILSTIDTDIKGDAFEYFLKQTTSTNNDLGEYFTPRHIIKTVVNLVAPRFKEKVYDPFCGTGGFLTEAFNYIKENNIIEDKEDLKSLKQNTFFGGEITTTARIAKMNMILHGDVHSGVKQVDSLKNPIDGEYDIVITNIPFSQTTEFGALYYNGISRKNGDSTCVLHCLRALKEGGRMALVVPEGFLFRKDISRVREFLLSNAKLQGVISLPQGAFLPYTGIKTDILYFTNAHQIKDQGNYWYFDVKNDGYSLDNRRKRLKGKNDLNKVEESDFKKVEKDGSLKENLFEVGFRVIDLKKVKENDYNLLGNFYLNDRLLSFPSSSLKKLTTLFADGNWIESKDQSEDGIRLIQTGNIGNGQYLDKKDKARYVNEDTFKRLRCIEVKENDILVSRLPDPVGRACMVPFLNTKMITAIDCTIVRFDEAKILPKYFLIFSLSSIYNNQINQYLTGSSRKRISRKNLGNINIPLIPIEEQIRIINQFDKQKKMIEQKKQEILNLQKQIDDDINSLWKSDAGIEPVADKYL